LIFLRSQITTLVIFGKLEPELLCFAHTNGARVTFATDGPAPNEANSTEAVSKWVNVSVAKVTAAFADGLNIDFEHSMREFKSLKAKDITAFSKALADAMHTVNPHSHVTFDTPSEGIGQCGTQYDRDYDYKALAEVLDFLVVMDYDSNDPHHASPSLKEFYPSIAKPYIYDSRGAAAAGCASQGYERLCTKAELEGFERCAYGWCSDFEGLWNSKAKSGCGAQGFVAHTGPAGAYCCTSHPKPPCPTCFYANAPLPVVQAGVSCYEQLGVPASKLVLAMPWYGYGKFGEMRTRAAVVPIVMA
jgi:hypothetical protein